MNPIKPALALAVGLISALPADAASRISVAAGNGQAAITVTSEQGYRDRWDRRRWRHLDRRTIERRLYRAGYVRVLDMHLVRDRYYVRAVHRRGAIFQLVVDAGNGRILSSRFVSRGRLHRDSRRW